MEYVLEIIKNDYFLIGLAGMMILLLILYIVNIIKLTKIRREYIKFVKKLGNGNNIDEMLRQYMDKVEQTEQANKQLYEYCHKLDKDITKCIQKVGIVRYSAFKDTGSDLSFALALLDEKNDGVVLNGIYSREMSNIYAKPVVKGTSSYTISEEEQKAIEKAIQSETIYKIKE